MAWYVRFIAMVALGIWSAHAPARAEDEAALRAAEQLGSSLYRVDRALRMAAQESARSRAFRRDERVQGMVAEVQPEAVQITYVGQDADAPAGLYHLAVDYSGKVLEDLRRMDPMPLNERLARQYAIVGKAKSVERIQCSNEVATVVLPAGDGWHAYVLPRAAFPDVYLLGGSYRVDLSATGDTVTDTQALASECVILQNKPGSGALLFAEDRGTLPNELHVYISRLANKPLYVTTTSNGRTWLISEGRIQPVPGIPASAG